MMGLTVFSTCARICIIISWLTGGCWGEGLRCVCFCFLGWPLGPLREEEEDFGTTLNAPGTFHYSVIVIWVNNAVCLNIPELAVTS